MLLEEELMIELSLDLAFEGFDLEILLNFLLLDLLVMVMSLGTKLVVVEDLIMKDLMERLKNQFEFGILLQEVSFLRILTLREIFYDDDDGIYDDENEIHYLLNENNEDDEIYIFFIYFFILPSIRGTTRT